jgi:hypothetical protein
MIGDLRYCLDPKTYKIFTATEIGVNVSETGYVMIRLLLSDNTTKTLEVAHVHVTANGAEEHRMRVQPLIEEAEALIKEATDRVDSIRFQVIGYPEFKEIAQKIVVK